MQRFKCLSLWFSYIPLSNNEAVWHELQQDMIIMKTALDVTDKNKNVREKQEGETAGVRLDMSTIQLSSLSPDQELFLKVC